MNLAPIILFVYNRLDHTKLTIEALKNNLLAVESDLIIFSDGPKKELDIVKIEEVRRYIKNVGGFKSIKVIERENNLGLAASIMGGVTDVVNEYGKVIVLEDDIITSQYFLQYMNDALDLYKDNDEVMHVSGYFYPRAKNLPDTFFYNQSSCWGWGTWKRAWSKFNGDVDYLLQESDKIKNKRNGYYKIALSQLKANKRGDINTWGARWQMSILLNNGYCLHANPSFTYNIGHDGSGENCNLSNNYNSASFQKYKKIKKEKIIENIEALKHGTSFLNSVKPSLIKLIYLRLKRDFIKKYKKLIIKI